MNDGNDSNVERETVLRAAEAYRDVFFNTSIPKDLGSFPGPVVLTVNPGNLTDGPRVHLVEQPPPNLMFVRFRTNAWNLDLCDKVVDHYTARGVPVVLTFMAYYTESVPEEHRWAYSWRKRTLNSYWVVTPSAWDSIAARYAGNALVYTCGKDATTFSCARCGNCAREYHVAKLRTVKP